jgi:ribonuclease T2
LKTVTSRCGCCYTQIKDLESELLQNWGTLSCRSRNATELWSHEWRRHGTCSGMDQHAYFRAALDFKARFNLTAVLAGAGIVPSGERAYELRSIRDAVTEATGSAPSVECNRDERDEAQLYRVYQCVGRDGRGPVHCPRHLESRCPDKVNFPPF